jgi:hypothetical protein
MVKGRTGFEGIVPEIFKGVVVPEAGHLDDQGPQAIVSLRNQISRTFDRLVRVEHRVEGLAASRHA